MKKEVLDIIVSSPHYQHRIMACIIVSQLIMISVFKFWPETEFKQPAFVYPDNEVIVVEEMIVTRQANAPASPPKPQVPIPAPTYEIIEEDILDFPEMNDFQNENPLSESITTGQRGDEDLISGNPDRPPRIAKIFEPILTEEAKLADIKAIIFVNFLVNRDGSVREAYVSEVRLYDKKGENYEVVKDLRYGLIQASLEAAYKWRFVPATEGGEKVGAYTQNSFTFGF